MKARATQEEIEKYRKIKEVLSLYNGEAAKALEALEEAYKAEGRPMCGTLETPGMFAPKSAAIKMAGCRYEASLMKCRRITLALGGAKMIKRLHTLEICGLV